jgi:hypothetical protein
LTLLQASIGKRDLESERDRQRGRETEKTERERVRERDDNKNPKQRRVAQLVLNKYNFLMVYSSLTYDF